MIDMYYIANLHNYKKTKKTNLFSLSCPCGDRPYAEKRQAGAGFILPHLSHWFVDELKCS